MKRKICSVCFLDVKNCFCTPHIVDIIERLEKGVRPEGGMTGDIELYDIDGANDTMAEAAEAEVARLKTLIKDH